MLDVITLKKLCLETYDSDEILASKTLLKTTCDGKNIDLGTLLLERKGTDKDTRNLEDVLMMFSKLDKNDYPNFWPLPSMNFRRCTSNTRTSVVFSRRFRA